MHCCKATDAPKLGHNTVCANVNDRPTNTADLTPKAYLVYTKAKQKKFTFTEISFGNVHFCKATATSELGYNINKIRKFKNEMLHQLRLKPAPQEHAK